MEIHRKDSFVLEDIIIHWVENNQCQAIIVGFKLYIGIESKLSISIIGFDLELGEFCHDFHSISIPINHSGTHLNLPAVSISLK